MYQPRKKLALDDHKKFWKFIEQGNKKILANKVLEAGQDYTKALQVSMKNYSEIYTTIACLYIGEISIHQRKYHMTIESLQKTEVELITPKISLFPKSKVSCSFLLLTNIIKTIIEWINTKQYMYLEKAYRYFIYITIFAYFDCFFSEIQSQEQKFIIKHIREVLKSNNSDRINVLKIIAGKTSFTAIGKQMHEKLIEPYLNSRQKNTQNIKDSYRFQVYRSLAVFYEQLGLFVKAVVPYELALKHLSPSSHKSEAWKIATTIRMNCCHALAAYQKHNFKQAIEYANKVLKVKTNHKTPDSTFFRKIIMHLLLCKIYAKQGLYEESVRQYKKMKTTSGFIKDIATKKILQPYTNTKNIISLYVKFFSKKELYKIIQVINKFLKIPEVVNTEIMGYIK